MSRDQGTPRDGGASGHSPSTQDARPGEVRTARFGIGDVVKHRIFPFRGVIFDVDPEFANTEDWWLAIPDAAIARDGVPDGWGLLVVGRDGKLRVRKQAPKLDRQPMSFGMTAALLRAAVKTAERRR